ncbi:MAG: N-acetyltransferase [Burkholderiaceae bacterium]|nr:MAG: N-acetyltransferase [Burkholderiaceae bacterium]
MIYRLSDTYYVRPLEESDLDGAYRGWFEDQEVCKFNSHGKLFKTRSFFQSYLANLNAEDKVVWAICHNDDGHIGNISLQDISFINRTAEFAILIGEKKHWGKGVARLAGAAILTHGFNKLNLERIYCGAAANNEGMNALAASLGMKIEGRRRMHLFLEGARVDVLDHGILREEFMAAR